MQWSPFRRQVGGVIIELHPVKEIIINVQFRTEITPSHFEWDEKLPRRHGLPSRKLPRSAAHRTRKCDETFVLLMYYGTLQKVTGQRFQRQCFHKVAYKQNLIWPPEAHFRFRETKFRFREAKCRFREAKFCI